jgi:hypothetical protein
MLINKIKRKNEKRKEEEKRRTYLSCIEETRK